MVISASLRSWWPGGASRVLGRCAERPELPDGQRRQAEADELPRIPDPHSMSGLRRVKLSSNGQNVSKLRRCKGVWKEDQKLGTPVGKRLGEEGKTADSYRY